MKQWRVCECGQREPLLGPLPATLSCSKCGRVLFVIHHGTTAIISAEAPEPRPVSDPVAVVRAIHSFEETVGCFTVRVLSSHPDAVITWRMFVGESVAGAVELRTPDGQVRVCNVAFGTSALTLDALREADHVVQALATVS